MNANSFIVNTDQSGKRLDIFLAEKYKGIDSRSKIKTYILNNNVLVNNKKTRPHYIIKENDRIYVEIIKITLANMTPP